MIGRKTVFIIGAGASVDYGFPLGSGLRSEIADLMAFESEPPHRFVDLDVEEAVAEAISDRKRQLTRERMAQAATSIAAGINEVSSIDALIETRQDEAIEILGKIAITRQILWHERESFLTRLFKQNRYTDPSEVDVNREKLTEGWISVLSEIVFDRHTRESLDTVFANCAFVVFNYDRCLETLLARSIELRFGVPINKAHQLVNQAKIFHPYGRVGDPFVKSENHVRFGYKISDDLYGLSQLIKTYSETVGSNQHRQIHEVIARAQDVVYLGFGYASQNIKMLTTDLPSQAERIFATTKGFSRGDGAAVAQRAKSILKGQRTGFSFEIAFDNQNAKCREYLDSCKARLSAT